MDFYRPHIDTPYRFKEFKYTEGLLGLQFMVMLCDFTPDNGQQAMYLEHTSTYMIIIKTCMLINPTLIYFLWIITNNT